MYAIRNREDFDSVPELGMGFHFGTIADFDVPEPLIVINGTIGLTPDDVSEGALIREYRRAISEIAVHGLELHEDWIIILETMLKRIGKPRAVVPSDDIGLFLEAFGRWAPRTGALLGRERLHESPPFPISNTRSQRFVRFSAFAKDRRVRPDRSLLPGTYVTSELDAKYAPSGCAVVGRYALPNPLPAVHRFDIAASAGFNGLFGTVAPAFGQAGGGSEIELLHGAPAGSVTGPSTIPIY